MRRFQYLYVFSGFNHFFLFFLFFYFPSPRGTNYQQKTEATLTSTFWQRNRIGNDICETQQFGGRHHLSGLSSTVVLFFIHILAYTMN